MHKHRQPRLLSKQESAYLALKAIFEAYYILYTCPSILNANWEMLHIYEREAKAQGWELSIIPLLALP